jgi:hypothetical protein
MQRFLKLRDLPQYTACAQPLSPSRSNKVCSRNPSGSAPARLPGPRVISRLGSKRALPRASPGMTLIMRLDLMCGASKK